MIIIMPLLFLLSLYTLIYICPYPSQIGTQQVPSNHNIIYPFSLFFPTYFIIYIRYLRGFERKLKLQIMRKQSPRLFFESLIKVNVYLLNRCLSIIGKGSEKVSQPNLSRLLRMKALYLVYFLFSFISFTNTNIHKQFLSLSVISTAGPHSPLSLLKAMIYYSQQSSLLIKNYCSMPKVLLS